MVKQNVSRNVVVMLTRVPPGMKRSAKSRWQRALGLNSEATYLRNLIAADLRSARADKPVETIQQAMQRPGKP